MHEANTALLDILVDNSVIRPECPEVADFAVFCLIHSTYPQIKLNYLKIDITCRINN